MKHNYKWETLVSLIITVIIISVIIIAMIRIITKDNELNFEYDKINYISLLENNTNKLIKKLDTSSFQENDIFYIYQSWSTIKAFSGTNSEDYKYINYLGEYIQTGSYQGIIYTRQCIIEKASIEWQMIKCWIKELIRK